MANPLNQNQSGMMDWLKARQQEDPSTYAWNKSGINADNIGAYKGQLQQAGLWRPEYENSQVSNGQAGEGAGWMDNPNLDLSALNGYTAGSARGQGYDNINAVFDAQGSPISMGTNSVQHGMHGRDYATMAAVLAGGYGMGAGFGAMGVGAGAGAGAGAAGNGAFLGEGVGSGVGAWDTAGGAAWGAGDASGAGLTSQVGTSALEPIAYNPGEFSGVMNAGGAADTGALSASGQFAMPSLGATVAPAGSAIESPALYGGLTAGNWASLGQGAIGLYGQHRAIGAAQDATNQANQTAQGIYNQQRSDNAPLLAARDSALGKINALLADPSSVSKEPGYQFGLDQGQKQLDNNAAAAGNYYSGGQQKAAARYNQDYASTKFDQSLNRLTNLAGLGQVGANNTGNALQQYGQQTSQNMLNMGGARGSGYAQMGKGIGNALGQIGTSWNQQDANNQVWQNPNRNPWGGPG